MATHGDIIDITYNHPTLGSGVFVAISNQGNTMDPGGIRTADDDNAIGSNGELIQQKNRVRGSFEVVIENDTAIREDAVKLAELAAHPDPAQWTFTLQNGTIWTGKGVPVGDIKPDTTSGQLTLKVAANEFKKL